MSALNFHQVMNGARIFGTFSTRAQADEVAQNLGSAFYVVRLF